MNIRIGSGLLRGASIGALLATTVPAMAIAADDGQAPAAVEAEGSPLGDIVVSARRVDEKLQDVPIAVSAVSATAIERLNIQGIDRIANVVPNVAITPIIGSPSGNIAFIRGIGNSDPQSAIDPPVGEYLDGVYIARSTAANFELVDLARIEVLRGPQGTLFGRNTTGGAINLVTKAPSKDFGVEEKLSYATFAELSSRTKVNTGVLGGSGLSFTGIYLRRQRHGDVDDPTQSGSNDPGAIRQNAFWARGHGAWGGLTADYTFDYTSAHLRPSAFQIGYANARTTTYYGTSPGLGGSALVVDPGDRRNDLSFADAGPQQFKIHGHALTLEYEFSPAATLKSISAYREYDKSGPLQYGPGGLRGLTTTGVQGVLLNTSRINQHQSQKSEEVQLYGDVGDFAYIGGLYYFHEKALDDGQTNLTSVNAALVGVPTVSRTVFNTRATSTAAFGQLTYKPEALDGKLEAALGARHSRDKKFVNQTLTVVRQGDKTFTNTSYNATLSYHWTSDVTTFARFGTGYRSGGFNIRAPATIPFLFNPEKAKIYEVGVKSELFDRRLRFNATAFYNDYKGLQVTQFVGTSSTGAQGFTLNADADYRGFEAELTAVPIDGLTFYANVGYTDARYKQIFFPNPTTSVLTDYSDIAKFPYVPKWTLAAGAEYLSEQTGFGRVLARVDYTYGSKRYFHTVNLSNVNPYNDQIADPGHALVNLRTGLTEIALTSGTTAEVSLWIDNLFDKSYRVIGIDFGPNLGFAGNVYGLPRRIGVDVKVGF